jgi:NAD-dependent deacetylase
VSASPGADPSATSLEGAHPPRSSGARDRPWHNPGVESAHEATLDLVAEHLAHAQRVLFVTGAGLSADSGLPTYRGVGGLYDGECTAEGVPIEAALSGAMFRRRPELTWKYLLEVERACRSATFNAGHRLIAQLEQTIETVLVLTQNVDGFHQRAGSTRVIDIHGDLHDLQCTRCAKARRVSSYVGLAALPRCACGGIERPDVVLFGENLPAPKLECLNRELALGFDLVVSVGTSGIFPYVRAPMVLAEECGWPSVDINPLPNEMTSHARHHLPLGAARACEALWERLAHLG